MAFADLTPEEQDDRVWDALQQLLGSNPSQQDYVMLYTAAQAVIGGLEDVIMKYAGSVAPLTPTA